MALVLARLGSVFYILWGLLHVFAAWQVYAMAESIEPGPVQGRVMQTAMFLLFFSGWSIIVAIAWNWRNRVLGYWLNLVVVTVADIAFIAAILVPGHVRLWPGIVGPLLWMLGLALTTAGMITARRARGRT